jgi:hypothetical protein
MVKRIVYIFTKYTFTSITEDTHVLLLTSFWYIFTNKHIDITYNNNPQLYFLVMLLINKMLDSNRALIFNNIKNIGLGSKIANNFIA